MPVSERFEPEYHRQNTTIYCGSACAQMVLNYLGAGLIPQTDIKDLSDDNTSEPFWATAPDGLNFVMNHLDPRGEGWFRLFEESDPYSITRKIIWTLHRFNVAPIALVFDMAHWVVVFGYDGISAYPTSSTDNTYNIDNLIFFVHNPAPALSGTDGTIQHLKADGCAGGRSSITIVPGRTWFEEYMTGVFGDGSDQSRWIGKFIAVCDPEPSSKENKNIQFKKSPFNGKEIINSKKITELAIAVFNKTVLKRISGIKKETKKYIQPGTPVLVKHLGHKNKYYYLTPITDITKNIYSLISNDARYGNFREASYTPKADKPLFFSPLTKNEILKAIDIKIKTGGGAPIKIFKNTVSVSPVLVWKPCCESLSPFMPFHVAHIGDENFYVRIDKKVFTKLTTAKFGL